MNEVLSVNEVSKSFGGLSALSGVSLAIGEHEVLGLIGPNGSGKTTLLNCITGFFHADKGKISFMGKDITKKAPHTIFLMGIGRTFQGTRLYWTLTPAENLRISLLAKNVESPEKRVANILELLRIQDAKEEARLLNVFEQKKLEIGARLVSDPRLLLLDEPASGLNQEEQMELVSLVKSLREQGKSILVVEHTMRLILDVSDRVIMLDEGKKIAEGRPREIFSDPRVIEGYLGSWRPQQ